MFVGSHVGQRIPASYQVKYTISDSATGSFIIDDLLAQMTKLDSGAGFCPIIEETLFGGDAFTTTWDETINGGDAFTTSWDTSFFGGTALDQHLNIPYKEVKEIEQATGSIGIVPLIFITGTDQGTGSFTSSLTALLDQTESATGSSFLPDIRLIALQETGAGSVTPDITVSDILIAESAAGNLTGLSLKAEGAILVADMATTTETLSPVLANLTIIGNASAGSMIPGHTTLMTDQATAQDLVTAILVNMTNTDQATGSYTSSIGVSLPTLTETATGTFTLVDLLASLVVSELGYGGTALHDRGIYVPASDSATGSSTVDALAKLLTSDQATGTIVITTDVFYQILDQAEGISTEPSRLKELFTYLEDLAPGETLTIDAEDLLVYLDGVNTRDKYEGDFPRIDPGDVSFQYYDLESSRDIEIKVIKKDRLI